MVAFILFIIWAFVNMLIVLACGLPLSRTDPWPPVWHFLVWFVLSSGVGGLLWYLYEEHYDAVGSFLVTTAFIIAFFGTGIQVFFGKGGGKRRR